MERQDEDWSDKLADFKIDAFETNSGIQVLVPNDANAAYFLNLLFGEESFNLVVEEINQFARQKLVDSPQRLALWCDINKP